MLAFVPSASLLGCQGHRVSVEVHAANGLPGYTIVGLPDTSCRESRDRVRAALLSSGLAWPNMRITVNLAPTGLPKAGAGLDLAIAMGVLAATEQIPVKSLADLAFIGELGLDGSLRAVRGALPLIDALDSPAAVVPLANVHEARLITRCRIIAARTLREIYEALSDNSPWPPQPPRVDAAPAPDLPDLVDVRGQPLARRALEVAAAGGHHLLMVGPPGAGKTMLARRLPALLPPLDTSQSIEVTCVHSSAGVSLPPAGLVNTPPFRAPHHTATTISLVGGGSATLRPGEISLAHCGALFLDELGEFAAVALDALRQPLEEGVIRLTRAHGSAVLPSRFVLIAAMNPCPCGGGGGPGLCRCSPAARARYNRRLSGPLLDRFDLRIDVQRPEPDDLLRGDPGEPSACVRKRVLTARQRAVERGVRANVELAPGELDMHARLATDALPAPRVRAAGRQAERSWLSTGARCRVDDRRPRRQRRHPSRTPGAGPAAALATARESQRLGPRCLTQRLLRLGARCLRRHTRRRGRRYRRCFLGVSTWCCAAARPIVLWHGLESGNPAVLSQLRDALARTRLGKKNTDPMLSGGLQEWRRAAASTPVHERWQQLCDQGVSVAQRGGAQYPAALDADPDAPAVLFYRGDIDCIAGVRVAIIGTRNCTRYGYDVAVEFGQRLSDCGISVVSGLALGIDAAAHQGAMRGVSPPIAVVGSGLDVVYPRANRKLWASVESKGVVLSEAPLGAPANAWRFPARNRIIAALADALVVVESHEKGGSLLTAYEAMNRNRPIFAVPGAVRSKASAGTNELIQSGAARLLVDIDEVIALVAAPAVKAAQSCRASR